MGSALQEITHVLWVGHPAEVLCSSFVEDVGLQVLQVVLSPAACQFRQFLSVQYGRILLISRGEVG